MSERLLYVRVPAVYITDENPRVLVQQNPHAIRLPDGDLIVCVGTESEVLAALKGPEKGS